MSAAAAFIAAGVLLLARLAGAQAEPVPAFEVASVRQHLLKEGFVRRSPNSNFQCPPAHCGISGNRFTEEAASLKDLIMDAYNVKDFQIAGLPEWGDSGRDVYDIAAKVEGNRTPTPAQVRGMLQTLLADRFHLQLHHQTRSLPVYLLVVARKGPKLEPVPPEDEETAGELLTMEQIAAMLSPLADRPVVDQTFLKGRYSFEDTMGALDIRQLLLERRSATEAASGGASLFTQVQEQWGMKLEPKMGLVDVLVIDRVERPTEN